MNTPPCAEVFLFTSGAEPDGKSFVLNYARFTPALIPNVGEKLFCANATTPVLNTRAMKLIFFISKFAAR